MNAYWSLMTALWATRWWVWWGQKARALAVVERALVQHPDDPELLGFRYHLLAELGRAQEALGALDRLVQLQAGVAAHWFNRGFLQEQLGQWSEAEASFRQAVALDERLDRAWYGLGLVLIRLQRPDEALAALRRNTELQPMSPHGWYQLAQIHANRQEPEQVVKIIRHLKGFEPKVAAQLERETGLTAKAA